MKTVDRLNKLYADRLAPLYGQTIWKEGPDGWWANLKPGWRCSSTEAGTCHEYTLRELERALRNAEQKDPS